MAFTWKLSGTTATGTDGSTTVTIKGLKPGLTLQKKGDYEGKVLLPNGKYVPIATETLTAEGGGSTTVVAGLFDVTAPIDTETIGAIAVNQFALGSSDVVLSINKGGNPYELELGDSVAPATVSGAEWSQVGTNTGIAKLEAAKVAKGYSVSKDGKTISYTDEQENKVLAVVSGLKPGTNDFETFETVDGGNITLNKDLVGESNVAVLKGDYKLKMDTTTEGKKLEEPALASDTAWTINGTTAYLVGTVTAGYTQDTADTAHVIYKPAERKVLAEISGLEGSLEGGANLNAIHLSGLPVINEAADTIKTYATITVGDAALGNRNVSLVSGKGYQLAIGNPVDASDTVRTVSTIAAYQWIDNGASIGYDIGTNDYYSIAENSSHPSVIEYHPANLTRAFTLVGIHDTVAVDNTDYNNAIGAGITLGTTATDSLKVTLDKRALDSKTVSLVSNEGYEIVQAGVGAANNTIPVVTVNGGAYWQVSGSNNKTAKYNQSLTSGYTLTSDNTVLEYIAPAVKGLATIAGLASSVTEDNIGDGITTAESGGKNYFELKNAVLGTKDVSLTNPENAEAADKYTLKLDSDVTKKNEAESKANMWSLTGSTAVYGSITGAYYGLGSDNLVVNYTPATVNAAYVKLTGLNPSVTVKDDGDIEGITPGILSSGAMEVQPPNAQQSPAGFKFTLNEKALSKSNVTSALALATGIKVTLDVANSAKTVAAGAYDKYMHLTNQNAFVVQGGTKYGWSLSSDSLKAGYVAAIPAETLATISGVNVNEITNFGLGSNDVTLYSGALRANSSVGASISGTGYTLKLGSDVPTLKNEKYWSVNGTNAKFTDADNAHYSLEADSKSVKYYPASSKIANVSGLASGLTVGTGPDKLKLYNGAAVAASIYNNSVITIGKEALNKQNITLTKEGTGAAYKLKLIDNITTSVTVGPAKNDIIWSISGGTATGSVVSKQAEYKKGSSNDSLISYAAATNDSTKGFTISGLTNLKMDKDANGNDIIQGIAATIPGTGTASIGTIEIGSEVLPKSSVSLGKSVNNYKLVLDGDVTKQDFANETWDFSGLKSGNATYKADITAGYSVSSDGKTINYTADSTKPVELAKVTGLKKSSDPIVAVDAFKRLHVEGATIKPEREILDATNTKLTTNYGYVFGDDCVSVAANLGSSWTFNGATATYDTVTSGIYKVDKGTTLNYTAGTTKNLITITGLEKKNLQYAADGVIEGIYGDSTNKKVILADSDILGTKEVVVTANNSSGYSLDSVTTAQLVDTPDVLSTYVEVKSAKANIKENVQAGYTVSGNKLTYAKANSGSIVASLTGLNKAITTTDTFDGIKDQGIAVTLPEGNNKGTIKFDNRALTTSTVNLTSGSDHYALDLETTGDYAVVATKPDPGKFWSVNGGKAILKNGISPYYTKGATAITYNGESATTNILTVSGLLKTATAADMVVPYSDNDKTVALTAQVLDTSKAKATVKLKMDKSSKDTYKLRLYGSDTEKYEAETVEASTPAAVKYAAASWVTSKGKALYQATVQANGDGYDVAADGQSAVYTMKEVKGKTTTKTYMTLSGVKDGAQPNVNKDTNVVTLTKDDLNSKKVTLGKNDPYTLALAGNVPTATPQGTQTIEKKLSANKLTVTAQNGVTEDYTLSDSKTVSYTKAKDKKTVVASVTGLTKNTFQYPPEEGVASAISITENQYTPTEKPYTKITFGADQVDTTKGDKTKVTAGGVGYGFEFNTSGIQIAGTKDSDIIISTGGKVSITPGKGNDVIDLASSGGNTYIYGKGDGNDYIKDFSASSDVIVLTGIKDITTAKDSDVSIKAGENSTAVLVVGTGSITLAGSGLVGNDITVAGKNGTKKKFNTANNSAADLLADDNFITSSGSELSDLVQPVSEGYTPYDFSSSSLQLTKEDKFMTQLTYTSNKK